MNGAYMCNYVHVSNNEELLTCHNMAPMSKDLPENLKFDFCVNVTLIFKSYIQLLKNMRLLKEETAETTFLNIYYRCIQCIY